MLILKFEKKKIHMRKNYKPFFSMIYIFIYIFNAKLKYVKIIIIKYSI